METRCRMPLQDLPLEQFLTPSTIPGGKTPRNHKRPLSPSRIASFNPAKRRILDGEGIPPSNDVVKSCPPHPMPFTLSNMHAVTPTRLSQYNNGLGSYGSSQGILSPSSSHPCSPSRELYPKPTIESSTDPQSRHYPGFTIFRDGELHRLPVTRVPLPLNGDTQVDKFEEDKENVPLGRRAKKLCSKKRPLTGLGVSGASCPNTPAQRSKVVYSARTPFSARQALR